MTRRPTPKPRASKRSAKPALAATLLIAAALPLATLPGCEATGANSWFTSSANAEPAMTPNRDQALDHASAALLRNDPHGALRSLEPLLSALNPADPQAHELAGKAHLRLADYDHAIRHLERAQQAHAHPSDRQRAADLRAFATGLAAYAQADFAAARAAWVQIDHPALRRSAFANLESRPAGVAVTSLDGGPERSSR